MYVIEGQTLLTLPEKIETVLYYKLSQTPKQLLRFLRLAGHYKKFTTPKLSDIEKL